MVYDTGGYTHRLLLCQKHINFVFSFFCEAKHFDVGLRLGAKMVNYAMWAEGEVIKR